jgi:16S rRNA (guanine1207-N2)-methyltransferase
MPHYFDPSPAAPSRPSEVVLTLADLEVTLRTDRGVFSHARVDPGTLELLRLDSPPIGPGEADLLDLGCGYGPVAVTLASRYPRSTVWAVDVNSRAVQLTESNAARLGLPNVRALPPEAVPAGLRFAGLWSNPPVRIGKAALHDLLGVWLARLAPAGFARIVVHKHLGGDSLAAWLAAEGFAVEKLGSKRGYRLLQATRGGDAGVPERAQRSRPPRAGGADR